MTKAKFKVGDLVEDKYEGCIREITAVDSQGGEWVYSLDSMGWLWIPELDLELIEEYK